jgi:hypothetical protein
MQAGGRCAVQPRNIVIYAVPTARTIRAAMPLADFSNVDNRPRIGGRPMGPRPL